MPDRNDREPVYTRASGPPRPGPSSDRHRVHLVLRVLFSVTALLGAFLLFLVEPMFARMVLPLLGGAPGGGFSILAIEHEGRDVAKWMNQRGVTAFVLRYRVGLESGTPPAMDRAASMKEIGRAHV